MNKQQFLEALRARLWQLSEGDRNAQLGYYSEMIDDRMEDGMSEQEAVAALESIDVIANRILQDTPLPVLVKSSIKEKKSGWTAFTVLLLIVLFPVWFPLLCALFAVLITVFAVLWSLVLALFCVVLALIITGIAVALAPLLLPISLGAWSILYIVGAGLVLAGVGALMLVLGVLAFRGAVLACKGIVFCIKRIFIRKEKKQ